MESIYIIKRDGKPCGIVQALSNIGPLAWFHANCPAYSMAHAIEHEGYSVEEGEPDCQDVESLIEGIAARTSITLESTFVPFSQSRNANAESGFGDGKPWRSLNWRVTVKRFGRDVIASDYSQGVAYAPASKLKTDGTRYGESLKAKAIDAETETGRAHSFGAGVFSRDGIRDLRKPIAGPSVGAVLASLASDARVIDEGPFEDWADSLGYDPDSRKAESIYRQCLDIATRMRAGLGAALVEELQLAASFN